MAFNSDAVLKLTRADFYWARTGTAKPENIFEEPASPWENIGHSSIEDILTVSTEGGESTQLGSIQNPSLRTSVSAAVRSFSVNFLQWDAATLKLYYGANAEIAGDGSVKVPEQPEPSEGAWFVILHDGARRGGLYAAKCSAIGDGDFSISDTDSLAQLPVRFTPQAQSGQKHAFEMIPPKAAAAGGAG